MNRLRLLVICGAVFVSAFLCLPKDASALITSGTYTLKTSGGDYSTWAAFWNDLGNLTGDLTLVVDASNFTESTIPAAVTENLNGYTLKVTAAQFPTTTDGTTGPRFDYSTLGAEALCMEMEGPGNVVIEGMSFINSAESSEGGIIRAKNITTNFTFIFRRNILSTGDANFTGISIADNTPHIKIYNNIHFGTPHFLYTSSIGDLTSESFISNNTAIVKTDNGMDLFSAFNKYGLFENNLARSTMYGYSFYGTSVATGNNNSCYDDTCTDASWASGSANRINKTTDPFTNSATNDYTLAPGSDPIDNGKDLSAYFTDDFFGNTRTGTWDIGAVEYGAVAASPTPTPSPPANNPPTITSVSDTPDPVTIGGTLAFEVDWSDADAGDVTRSFICKTDAFATSTLTCTGGAWASSTAFATTDPISVTYVAQAGDAGSQDYYAFVCDDDNACSASVAGVFYANAVPSISGVSAFPDPASVGSDVSFTVDWSDANTAEEVRAFICKTDAFATSTLTCTGGAWASSTAFATTDPAIADYTATAEDVGTNEYFAFVCDDNACSASATGTFSIADAGSADWWDASWQYRKKITLNNGSQSTGFSDFPVAVQLASSRINYNDFRSLGEDIRFIDQDNSTALLHEVEQWDALGTSTLWVRVPDIAAASSSDYLWMYYGNDGADSVATTTGVWESEFGMVQHLNAVQAGEVVDSTRYGRNGTASNAGITAVAGRLANAVEITRDTANERIAIPLFGSLGAFTMEMWFYPRQTEKSGMWGRDFDYGSPTWTKPAGFTGAYAAVGGQFPQGSAQPYTPVTLGDDAAWTQNAWNYAVISYDGSNMRVYANGNEITGSPVALTGQIVSWNGTTYLGYGGYHWSDSEEWFDGYLDEARLSTGNRSSDWIAFSYCSMNDSCLSYGNRESQSAGGTVTCSASATSTAFGTLTLGGVSQSSPDITLTSSCTYAGGCSLLIGGTGSSTAPGLWNSGIAHLIESATALLSAGVEGYGVQATTTAAGSGEIAVHETYDKTGNNVGIVPLTASTIVSSVGSYTAREVIVTHKAAIADTTPEGNYADAIIYSCVGN